MSEINHNAIVVTSWKKSEAVKAQRAAKRIFEKNFSYIDSYPAKKLVSNLLFSVANCYYSFFIAPDGSNEGWEKSEAGDKSRAEFIDWIKSSGTACDFVEVSFGGDEEKPKIVLH